MLPHVAISADDVTRMNRSDRRSMLDLVSPSVNLSCAFISNTQLPRYDPQTEKNPLGAPPNGIKNTVVTPTAIAQTTTK